MASGSRKRPVPKLLAKKLRLIRTRLGVGQAEMARLLSKTPAPPDGGMVSRFERGEREPNLYVLTAYARAVNISPAILIDDDWTMKDFDAEVSRNQPRR
jgi:transcriptional regulator with XRE-family HTH domain